MTEATSVQKIGVVPHSSKELQARPLFPRPKLVTKAPRPK